MVIYSKVIKPVSKKVHKKFNISIKYFSHVHSFQLLKSAFKHTVLESCSDQKWCWRLIKLKAAKGCCMGLESSQVVVFKLTNLLEIILQSSHLQFSINDIIS